MQLWLDHKSFQIFTRSPPRPPIKKQFPADRETNSTNTTHTIEKRGAQIKLKSKLNLEKGQRTRFRGKVEWKCLMA